MNHPAIDSEAVARLKRRLDRSAPTAPTSTGSPTTGVATNENGVASGLDSSGRTLEQPGSTGAGAGAIAKAKTVAAAKRVTVPLVARFRHELDRAVTRELGSLRTEVDQLRREVARTRAEHAAAIAALQEERQAR